VIQAEKIYKINFIELTANTFWNVFQI